MTYTNTFSTHLITKKIESGKWELQRPLKWINRDGLVIEVPKGFVTDYASVPRLPLVFSIFGNTAHAEAVLHDYLYSIKWDREDADKMFYEAMLSQGVSKWKAYVMYLAVRSFGWLSYPK